MVTDALVIVSSSLPSNGIRTFSSVSDTVAAGKNEIIISDGDHEEKNVVDLTDIGGKLYVKILDGASLESKFWGVLNLTLDGDGEGKFKCPESETSGDPPCN